ncbi:MAG: beta-ketoacyl synthase chain length factor [Alphaproteobacteria bacterium]|nr:beta-ketoacyl synthase chain length factor [Alphaproteobacteria bacterium]
MRVYVLGASIWGPGLEGWEASRAVLTGFADHVPRTSPPLAPAMLSATERRRTSLVVRLALNVAQAASAMAGFPSDRMRNVFATSNGDGAVVGAILEALSGGDGQVSPTQFHNSVHNAASGYWTIANRTRQPATCLGCGDVTMGTSLLKAITEVEVEREPLLLCVYDAPMPSPLAAKRPTQGAFAAGFVLASKDNGMALAHLEAAYVAQPVPDGTGEPDTQGLRELSRANPAARSLRLLQALARGKADRFPVALLDGHLDVEVEPCSGGHG